MYEAYNQACRCLLCIYISITRSIMHHGNFTPQLEGLEVGRAVSRPRAVLCADGCLAAGHSFSGAGSDCHCLHPGGDPSA